MEVKIKKLSPKAKIPAYAKPGDAGLDLAAVSREFDDEGNIVYGTGLAIEIPEGYVGLIFPRSSLSKYGLSMSDHVGVIDSGYRGEVKAKFKPQFQFDMEEGVSLNERFYNKGDRIAQMIILPYPHIDFVEVDELSETKRGEGGYGSTGQ